MEKAMVTEQGETRRVNNPGTNPPRSPDQLRARAYAQRARKLLKRLQPNGWDEV